MREPQALDAGIFDLDGVITQTARVHAQAWKQTFDPLLAARQPPQPPFDDERDYLDHVDGKPRLAGARDFLGARGIALPEGTQGDAPGLATLHALGARKNTLFRELLARDGVAVFAGARALVQTLRRSGRRTAVVSSSRNCRAVLAAAGMAGQFDAVVDGEDAARLGLHGKPAPDLFLEAARRLGVEPARAFVAEDALAGVQAARAGGFGLVVGVDRQGRQAEALRAHGADVVLESLSELPLPTDPCPPALAHLDEIAARLRQGRPTVFLDYDGTLSPIVDRPQDARLAAPMREVVATLAARHPLAVVSGRDLADVRALVDVPAAFYAGSHGFEIAAAGGAQHRHPEALARAGALDAAQAQLGARLRDVHGALVERKTFSLAVHYRLVADADLPRVQAAVDAARAAQPGLRVQAGKKVFDFQPDVDWHKGRAVQWLMEAIGGAGLVPLYVGDDVTDEDAFEALAGHGVTVVVLDAPRPTHAQYHLRSTDEVQRFLAEIAARLDSPVPGVPG